MHQEKNLLEELMKNKEQTAMKKEELIKTVKVALQDELVGQITEEESGLEICFLSGQTFSLEIKEK